LPVANVSGATTQRQKIDNIPLRVWSVASIAAGVVAIPRTRKRDRAVAQLVE
jgi:hypothetical protein